jgi:hypothetical protein
LLWQLSRPFRQACVAAGQLRVRLLHHHPSSHSPLFDQPNIIHQLLENLPPLSVGTRSRLSSSESTPGADQISFQNLETVSNRKPEFIRMAILIHFFSLFQRAKRLSECLCRYEVPLILFVTLDDADDCRRFRETWSKAALTAIVHHRQPPLQSANSPLESFAEAKDSPHFLRRLVLIDPNL